jgi:hypothetical protein
VSGLSGSARDGVVRDLHLRARGGSAGEVDLSRPRVGLYHPWQPSMDEGWTRWVLEMYGLDPLELTNPDVRAGDLLARYDVVIVADMGARQILEGFAAGEVPGRWAGGLGAEGVRALDAFVRSGGTLVALNGASRFAIDQLHLPVRDVTRGLDRHEYFMSGSIVEVETDPSHPVMSGMPERAPVLVQQSPVFATEDGFEGRVLARYGERGSPLLSGFLLGEERLRGYAAAVDVVHGGGRVILMGLRPQWRGQPFGSFGVLLNAALYTRAVAEAVPDSSGFWTDPEAEAADSAGANGARR